jgi:hypothetical protein
MQRRKSARTRPQCVKVLLCIYKKKNYKRRRQYTYNVTMRRVGATFVGVVKEYVLLSLKNVSVALGIEHTMRMRHVVICGLSCCAIISHIIS